MLFQLPPRSSSVLASVLAAGLMLTVASCTGHLTPLGPTPPRPRHLGSPIVLQAMRSQPPGAAGGCPAGWIALPAPGAPLCYRKLGTPVTITSAAVSPVFSGPSVSPVHQKPGPSQYGFMIAPSAADVAAVTAVTTTAYRSQGYLDISVAGRTWLPPKVLRPLTRGQFEIFLPSRNQVLQLHRILAPPS